MATKKSTRAACATLKSDLRETFALDVKREMRIELSEDLIMHAEFSGSRAQLESERIVPPDMAWPTEVGSSVSGHYRGLHYFVKLMDGDLYLVSILHDDQATAIACCAVRRARREAAEAYRNSPAFEQERKACQRARRDQKYLQFMRHAVGSIATTMKIPAWQWAGY